jgi:hypothetical protein
VTYKVTRVVGRATNRSFRLTHVVGRATSGRSFRVTKVVGRATIPPVAGGTFKVTHVVGRARVGTAPSGANLEPFQLVQLPDGAWVQTLGPAVFVNSAGQFVAPAIVDGVDLQFQSGASMTLYHVNPHTVFRLKSTALDPLYVSPHPDARPATP